MDATRAAWPAASAPAQELFPSVPMTAEELADYQFAIRAVDLARQMRATNGIVSPVRLREATALLCGTLTLGERGAALPAGEIERHALTVAALSLRAAVERGETAADFADVDAFLAARTGAHADAAVPASDLYDAYAAFCGGRPPARLLSRHGFLCALSARGFHRDPANARIVRGLGLVKAGGAA
jgi:hypothetical protein